MFPEACGDERMDIADEPLTSHRDRRRTAGLRTVAGLLHSEGLGSGRGACCCSEACGRDSNPCIHIPPATTRLFHQSAGELDVPYRSRDGAQHPPSLSSPRCQGAGGRHHSINGMVYSAAHRPTYDGWTASGARSWGLGFGLAVLHRSGGTERGAVRFPTTASCGGAACTCQTRFAPPSAREVAAPHRSMSGIPANPTFQRAPRQRVSAITRRRPTNRRRLWSSSRALSVPSARGRRNLYVATEGGTATRHPVRWWPRRRGSITYAARGRKTARVRAKSSSPAASIRLTAAVLQLFRLGPAIAR